MGSDPPGPFTALLGIVIAISLVSGAVAPAPAITDAGQVDPDSVFLRVDLQADGSATWRVEYRLRLDDDNATEAFESLRQDIEANRSAFEDRFADRMRPTVSDAESVTGREMELRNVTVSVSNTTIPQQYGVVAYTFVWTGFAAVDGDQLLAGDAIGGLFLDGETSLLVGWPADYQLVEVTPEPAERRDRAVVWSGRLDFGEGEPRVIVTSDTGPTSPTTTDGSPTDGAGPGDGDQQGGLPWGLLVAALVILIAAAGGIGWLYTRQGGSDGGAPAAASGPDDRPPDELLSNEERVLQLIEDQGGRMKQQQVATELEWTDAKTSQVVGELRDAGDIDVFRLGRENVISLPEKDDI